MREAYITSYGHAVYMVVNLDNYIVANGVLNRKRMVPSQSTTTISLMKEH